METPLVILAEVARTLESLGVRYVVVGSFASSMRGLFRSTGDIDILADISSKDIEPLVSELQVNFYVDAQAVRRAVTQSRSFNAIHFETVFKIDFFVSSDREFDRLQLARRQLARISPDDSLNIYVATSEDTILAKLRWFRLGGEVSNTQWHDVLGIIETQGLGLDTRYLREQAKTLRVLDLLEKALEEIV